MDDTTIALISLFTLIGFVVLCFTALYAYSKSYRKWLINNREAEINLRMRLQAEQIHTYETKGFTLPLLEVVKDASVDREKLYEEELKRKDELGDFFLKVEKLTDKKS